MRRRVAIVGGGLTGLAAAFELERVCSAAISLYEAGARLGGKVRTDSLGGFLVERGPDCFFSGKAGLLELMCELGLEEDLIRPLRGEFQMLAGGRMHRVSRGLISLGRVDSEAVRGASFLSEEGKRRAVAGAEEVYSGDDPSIRDFFACRYGEEFSRLVAEPLLAGTHGGDAGLLSLRALYPQYLEPASGGSSGAGFFSFRGGMGSLIERLASRLKRTEVWLGCAVEDVADLEADLVLLALPANRAARLMSGRAPEAAELMGRIRHASSVVVTLAFDRAAVSGSLEGTGFLVPEGEHPWLTGCTWSSEKWAGRAPEGAVLLRAFVRLDPGLADEELVARAREVVGPLLGIEGEPRLTLVDRWVEALPQYELGHLELVERMEAALPSGVLVAGTSYRGVGLPDCARQGREAARRLAGML